MNGLENMRLAMLVLKNVIYVSPMLRVRSLALHAKILRCVLQKEGAASTTKRPSKWFGDYAECNDGIRVL